MICTIYFNRTDGRMVSFTLRFFSWWGFRMDIHAEALLR